MDFIANSLLKKHLKESADPYRLLFTKGNDGVLMNLHDTDGVPQRYIDANSKALEMLGYEKNEILTMSPQDLIVKERRYEENDIETFDRQTRDRYVMEACLKKKDGNLIDVEMSGHCFDFMGSGITLSIVRDISRRKVYERKIENANDQWRNTFDSISDFVSVHDENYKIVRVNRALSDFLEMEPNELIGRRCYEVLHGTDVPWENCPHHLAMQSKEIVTEIIEDSAIGVPLQVRCCPCLDKSGNLIGTVHIARNISKRLQEERDRIALIKELNTALSKVKILSGLIPICASCKKIRDDQGYWMQIELYIKEHSEAEFTHGICPGCMQKLYPDFNPNE